jgi:hypothetical protein
MEETSWLSEIKPQNSYPGVINVLSSTSVNANFKITCNVLPTVYRVNPRYSGQLIRGWIILGWILERWDGVMWTGLVWLRIGTGGELL